MFEPATPLNYAGPTLLRRGRWFAVWIVLLIVTLFLIFSAASPWLNSDHHSSTREICASRLYQIGEGILMYASENGGCLPPDLRTIAEKGDLSANTFVCPASHDTPAAPGPTSRATANNIVQPGHESYIYIGAGLRFQGLPADAVIAYEPLANHGGNGMNVLFGDFHVGWLSALEATKVLKQLGSSQRLVRYPVTVPSTEALMEGGEPKDALSSCFLIVKEPNQGAQPVFVVPSSNASTKP